MPDPTVPTPPEPEVPDLADVLAVLAVVRARLADLGDRLALVVPHPRRTWCVRLVALLGDGLDVLDDVASGRVR